MVSVFLSYPSEVQNLGEMLSKRLTAAGFDVFFAPRDLQAAESFDRALFGRVTSADLFVFVITRTSILPGRYTLTELGLAERHLGSAISNRMLPLLIDSDIREQELPASLASVHILRPKGDIVAETIIALETLARPIRRRRILTRAAALAALVAAMVGAGYWTYESQRPPGQIYKTPDSLFATAVKDAGLPTTPEQFRKLALPESFIGKRLSLLAFSSFEGTDRDQDFWCVVSACNLRDFAPDLPDGRNEPPVESDAHVHSGVKALNFTPETIQVGDRIHAISATRHKRVFSVAGADRVWLYFWRWSDTNPRPRNIHNCDSSLDIHFRLDEGAWQHLTSLCGSYPGEFANGDVPSATMLNFLLNGASTFELGVVFRIQNVDQALRDRLYTIDDFSILAQWSQ